MKICLIISGGDFFRLPDKIEYDYCIACDSGYENAVRMGITPDVILGDFDSSKSLELQKLKINRSSEDIPQGKNETVYEECLGYRESYKSCLTLCDYSIPTVSFPKEKDDTDTMLAIKYAIELGYDHMILGCCLGRRFDHTMANIQSMAYAASHGCMCELYGGGEWMRTITPKDGVCKILRRQNFSLSLFSITDICDNLCIKGAKYCVSGGRLTNDFPLGHGNEWNDNVVKISISSGVMLLVESSQESE